MLSLGRSDVEAVALFDAGQPLDDGVWFGACLGRVWTYVDLGCISFCRVPVRGLGEVVRPMMD